MGSRRATPPDGTGQPAAALDDDQYRELLAFRTGLRRFLRWSEDQAVAAGLTGQQHQLLLAVRGHAGSGDPTIGDVAEHLLLRHHSAVELVDRAERAGLLRRHGDGEDRRLVRLQLTAKGRRVLDGLTAAHLEELSRLALTMHQFIGQGDRDLA
jgi:DNA-binding MarR family transcriptional regulator